MRREMPRGNLFEFPENLPEGEFFENLLKAPGVRLEGFSRGATLRRLANGTTRRRTNG